MINQNNSVSLAKFLGVVLFVILWIYLGDELIYLLSYWVFFLIPENQKIQNIFIQPISIYLSIKFGFPFTNPVSAPLH